MELLEYMRKRNKMTISEWEDTFEKRESFLYTINRSRD